VTGFEVTLGGKRYTWTGKRWYGPDFLEPPKTVIAELDALAAPRFDADDAALSDVQELLDAAKNLEDAGHDARALNLARKALARDPDHHGAAPVVMSILRKTGRSEEALVLADGFVSAGTKYPPLLTSRAAALCDLGRWDEALRQIRQVFAIGGGKGDAESLSVWSRIKAAAPELI